MNKKTEKQILSGEAAASLVLDVPTGSHSHVLDETGSGTLPGGAHRHAFRLPTGEIVETALDGQHQHMMCAKPDDGMIEWYSVDSGHHTHKVMLPDGTEMWTEIDGWHCHETDGTNWEMAESQHRHVMVLPTGQVVCSLMPGDDLEQLAHEAYAASRMANIVAKSLPTDPRAAYVAKMAVIAGVPTLQIVTKHGTADVVLSLSVGRADQPADVDLAAVVDHWGPSGNRMTKSLALGVDAKIGKRARQGVDVDAGTLEWVYESDTCRELLIKGAKLRGVIHLEKRGKGWRAKMGKIGNWSVLAKGAQLPPFGYSGLPVALAAVVHPDMMYWQEPNAEKAIAKRDALAETGFLSADCLAWVDGEVRKVVRRATTHLYKRSSIAPSVASLEEIVGALRKELTDDESAWVAKSGQDGNLCVAAADEVRAIALAEELADSDQHFLVLVPDTSETRKAWGGIAAMYVSKLDQLSDMLVCSSYSLVADHLESVDITATPGDVAKAQTPAVEATGGDGEPTPERDELEKAGPVAAQAAAATPVAPAVTVDKATEERNAKILAQFADMSLEDAMALLSQAQATAAKTDCATEMASEPETEAATEQTDSEGEQLTYKRMICKAADDGAGEERIAVGIVLEPGTVDAQGDTLSEETIKNAAHRFMKHYRNMGIQHMRLANDRITLLESYVTLADMSVNGETVKKGTWIMVTRYEDDNLWNAVKSGMFTGYSIGGFGERRPLE